MSESASQSKLLYDEPPLQVIPSLAKRIGLNEALVVQQLHYWLLNPKLGVERDGRKWIYNTIEQWVEQFPFWSRNTIRRILEGLEKKKIVLVGNYNALPIDRTKWYALDYKLLESYQRPKKKGKLVNFGKSGQVRQMDSPTLANGLPNFGKPLPETPSKTTNIDSFFATLDKSQIYMLDPTNKIIYSKPCGSTLPLPPMPVGWITCFGDVVLDRWQHCTVVDDLPLKEESEPTPPSSAAPPAPIEPTIPTGYEWWFAGDKANERHLLWIGKGRPKCGITSWRNPNKWNANLQGYVPCAACVQIANSPKPVPPQFTTDEKNEMAVLCYGSVDAWKDKRNASAMMGALKRIKVLSPGANEQTLKAFGRDWNENDFRGKKGQRPKPHQVADEWMAFKERVQTEVVNGGHTGTDEPRKSAILW